MVCLGMSSWVRDYSIIQWEAAGLTCVEANRQPDFDQGRDASRPLLASTCTCSHSSRRTLWKDESSVSRKPFLRLFPVLDPELYQDNLA
jgi:hypothetical protein